VTLERSDEVVPERIGEVVPFGAGESFGWRFSGQVVTLGNAEGQEHLLRS
jgi:hypothetical protein